MPQLKNLNFSTKATAAKLQQQQYIHTWAKNCWTKQHNNKKYLKETFLLGTIQILYIQTNIYIHTNTLDIHTFTHKIFWQDISNNGCIVDSIGLCECLQPKRIMFVYISAYWASCCFLRYQEC